MLSAAQVHQILSIRARIDYLESVMDVFIPSKINVSLKTYATACTFQIEPGSNASRGSFSKLIGMQPVEMKAWLSSINKNRKIEEVVMTKELVYSGFTFGQPCPLCVGLARLTVLNQETGKKSSAVIVVKFRKLLNNDKLNKLTQHEAENAIKTWKTAEIEDLFPKLYFVGQIELNSSTWECIGTERMDDIPRTLFSNIPFLYYQGAYAALKLLHEQGYVHGDPHIGNFMVVPKDSHHPVFHPSRIIMIDQDSLRALPTDPEDKALRNLLIVNDLALLFLWNNQYMKFYREHNDKSEALMDHMSQVFKRHLLCLPFVYFRTTRYTLDQLREMLRSQKPILASYNQLISTTTTDEIYEKFDRYFRSAIYSQEVEAIFNKEYTNWSKAGANKAQILSYIPHTPPRPSG